jgi:hypothetical protein
MASIIGVLLIVTALISSGCNPFAASCLARQKRGAAAMLAGTVEAGQVVMREAQYAVEGSQNDLAITWTDQISAGGPRLRVYGTRSTCDDYLTGSHEFGAPCASVGSAGGIAAPDARPCVKASTCQLLPSEFVQNRLTITNGRGNPDVLGPSAMYKLWIFGDATRAVSFTISGSWFHGPDC